MNAEMFTFDMPDEAQDLLLSNIPNEVLHGFRVPDFTSRFGISEREFELLMARARQTGEIDYRTAQALRKATERVRTELTWDLPTRIGLTDEELSKALLQLDAFLERERGEL